MTQPTFDFDPPPPTDPSAFAADIPRLSAQNDAVLSRLRRGPATNTELAAISLKYTSRISDLRKILDPMGMAIVCQRLGDGLTSYRIEVTRGNGGTH